MVATARSNATPGSPVRASAKQRRLDILAAALRVMQREGLRAVTHRSVATEARVPLAATTYYFRDLEDLITEAFLHWSQAQQRHVEEFHASVMQVLREERGRRTTATRLATLLADCAAAYVTEQVQRHRGDRILEFAFLHEAARTAKLRRAVREHQRGHLAFLERFHEEIGSARPDVDAQISHSLLLGLEKNAVLGDPRSDFTAIRAVLENYLAGVVKDGLYAKR